MSAGPSYWANYIFRANGVYLGGTLIENGSALPLTNINVLTGAVVLTTMGPNAIVQNRHLGGKAPVGVAGGEFSMRMNVKNEADYRLFLTRCERSQPVTFWPDWPLWDQWYLPLRTAGQTEFQPRREFPWDISGVTHTTRPPLVWVDGVAQTIVKTGTPNAGEVVVPEAGGFGVLTAPAGLSGTWLEFMYWPEMYVLIQSVGMAYAMNNKLVFDVSCLDLVNRVFTTA